MARDDNYSRFHPACRLFCRIDPAIDPYLSFLIITESPFPIKGHSKGGLQQSSCKVLSAHGTSLWTLQTLTFPVNVFSFSFRLSISTYTGFVKLNLTESSKSPASIAKSNKQWVGTCLYQEECKLLLINCGAVIRLWASSEADCEYPLDYYLHIIFNTLTLLYCRIFIHIPKRLSAFHLLIYRKSS